MIRFALYSRWEGSGALEGSELRNDGSRAISQQTTLAAVSLTGDREARVNGDAVPSFWQQFRGETMVA